VLPVLVKDNTLRELSCTANFKLYAEQCMYAVCVIAGSSCSSSAAVDSTTHTEAVYL